MNLSSSGKVEFEELRSLAFGGIGANYAAVGTSFANPVRLLKITNLTDAPLKISFNGVTDHDIVAAYSVCLYDYCSDKCSAAGILEQAVGNQLFVKRAAGAPSTGSVYVTLVYASQV